MQKVYLEGAQGITLFVRQALEWSFVSLSGAYLYLEELVTNIPQKNEYIPSYDHFPSGGVTDQLFRP